MRDQRLHVRVVTPEGMLWEGYASAVSSQNSEGNFDILPDHANFITLIDRLPIKVIGAEPHIFQFEKSVVSALNNVISIYGDITSATSGR